MIKFQNISDTIQFVNSNETIEFENKSKKLIFDIVVPVSGGFPYIIPYILS